MESKLTKIKFVKILKPVLGLFLLISLVLISCGTIAWAYKGKIYPSVGTFGINLGGKSKTEASKIIQEKITALENQNLQIKVENQIFSTNLKELGLQYDASKIADELYQLGRGEFFSSIFETVSLAFGPKNLLSLPEVNQDQFNNKTSQLFQVVEKPVVNTILKIEEGRVKIVAGETGIIVDRDKLKVDISSQISSPTPVILALLKIVPPKTEQESLSAAKMRAEEMIAQPLILSFENKIFTADQAIIGSWIVFGEKDGQISLSLDDQKINNFIEEIAKKIDIKPQDKLITESGQVLVQAKEGRALNRADALAKIKVALESETKQIVLAIEMKEAGQKIVRQTSGTPGLFEGKYIEINLSQQRLYIFEGQNQIGGFLVSTGRRGMPTPTGIYQILSKTPRAYSSRYRLYMPYWMQFTGAGHGIHELPEWAGGVKEGASHLGIPVSHGCVRLGVGPAVLVYNWVNIGTPVYIHR